MPAPFPRLVDLTDRSGPAHHQAFLEVEGWDPEWPIWCAEYFWEPIPEFLLREVAGSELVHLLGKANREWADGKDLIHLPADTLAWDITATGPTNRTYTSE